MNTNEIIIIEVKNLVKFEMPENESVTSFLPFTKVSKMIKLDPDVKMVSKDAVKCMQKSTVCWLILCSFIVIFLLFLKF